MCPLSKGELYLQVMQTKHLPCIIHETIYSFSSFVFVLFCIFLWCDSQFMLQSSFIDLKLNLALGAQHVQWNARQ